MDTMPSAEFRKAYSKLTEPTVVTVNGHVIGVWTPGGTVEQKIREPLPLTDDGGHLFSRQYDDRFNSRPFTPVPKTGVRDLR